MGSSIRNRALFEVAAVDFGYPFKSGLFNSEGQGLPLIRIRDLKDPEGALFSTEREYPESAAVRFGDALVGMDGEFRIYRWTRGPALLNQRVCRVRPLSGDELDREYLRAALEQPLAAMEREKTGTTVKHLNKSDLERVRIPWPDDAEARRFIGATQAGLDDKIELNRRMAETLDELARTHYLMVFGKMSSDGVTQPRSSHCALADVAALTKSTVNPQSQPEQLFDHFSLPAFDAGKVPHCESGEEIKSQKTLVPDDAVLLSKLNPQFPRVWAPRLSGKRTPIASTEFMVLIPKPEVPRAFLYCTVSSAAFTRQLKTYVTGTSGSHQRVKPQTIMEMSVPCGSPDTLMEFDRVAGPLLERAAVAIDQSETLREIRDALLPPLLDGRIEVPATQDEEGS